MKQVLTRILKILLLVLFTAYYGSTTLFIHTHKLRYIYITHSHPFGESTSKKPVSHQHTDDEYAFIDAVSFFVSTALLLFFAAILIPHAKKIKYSFKNIEYRNTDNFFIYLLRAPPLSIPLI